MGGLPAFVIVLVVLVVLVVVVGAGADGAVGLEEVVESATAARKTAATMPPLEVKRRLSMLRAKARGAATAAPTATQR